MELSLPMPTASGDLQALERRLTSGMKALGERIAPLELAADQQRMRHDVVVGKLDGLSCQVDKLGDKTEAVNARCDDLNLRLTVVEVAWTEQMKPGLERLRGLELKVAGAAVGGGVLSVIITELMRSLLGG